MSDLVQVSVSVPREYVADLYQFAARLISGEAEEAPKGFFEVPAGKEKVSRATKGFGKATVRKNYLGGTSDHWRPFLQALAKHPDEWVSWHDLCEAIKLSPKAASGMLGAAERRCKGYPPYYKSGFTEGDHWFLMSPEVAEMVNELAAAA
jgi:hypothetical protein